MPFHRHRSLPLVAAALLLCSAGCSPNVDPATLAQAVSKVEDARQAKAATAPPARAKVSVPDNNAPTSAPASVPTKRPADALAAAAQVSDGAHSGKVYVYSGADGDTVLKDMVSGNAANDPVANGQVTVAAKP